MTVKLGMYHKALPDLGPRLEALDLDLEVTTFNAAGRFEVDGAEAAPDEVALDYLWFSPHISRDKALPAAFDVAVGCRSLKVLQTFNAGLDNPGYRRVADKGVRICNSSAQGVAISEYVLGQAMAVLQPIEMQRAQQAEGVWRQTPFREISRTTWLIVGLGPIGDAVATRAAAFGARVTAVRRSGAPAANVDRVGRPDDLPDLLAEADVVVIACPLNDATRGLAGGDFFATLKPGAILINVARGAVIDDAALIAALDDGTVATAVLDVFHTEPLPANDPLWRHPGVRLTAHTSFFGDGVQDRWDQLFLDNIARFAKGEPLIREVDPADI